MKDPYLLHMFNSTNNVSPFDVNMAYEADFDGVIPYADVTLEDIHALTQDTIFSRGPTGVKRTGIFIGGRDFGLALDMLEEARKAMVPPFEVSVFAGNHIVGELTKSCSYGIAPVAAAHTRRSR